MTILTLELPDRIASLVEQRAHARGMTLNQHVVEILEESASSDKEIGVCESNTSGRSLTILDRWIANPIPVSNFHPLTRDAANER
jgi:hypothetical protein